MVHAAAADAEFNELFALNLDDELNDVILNARAQCKYELNNKYACKHPLKWMKQFSPTMLIKQVVHKTKYRYSFSSRSLKFTNFFYFF
jgi:hypothetical protein